MKSIIHSNNDDEEEDERNEKELNSFKQLSMIIAKNKNNLEIEKLPQMNDIENLQGKIKKIENEIVELKKNEINRIFKEFIENDYQNKYLLTATVRRDGSSRFGSEHRWGTFPSVSLAWRISEEDWFPKNGVLSDLKIRTGYGVTGSQASVSNYSYLASYNTSVYPFGYSGNEQAALVSATLSNPSIHWEEVAQSNIGFDATLFHQRATLSFDAYLKTTRDMLVKASIPITSGFEDTSTTYTNAGKVRNSGFEVSLHTVNLKGKLGWTSDLSYTYNRNKIIDLNSSVPYYINQINNSYVTILEKGLPINVFYGYVTDGIFQNEAEVQQHAIQPGAEAGDIRFKDLNNDGVINDEDRTIIGNPNPTSLFSLNNTLTWNGFELGIFFQGVAGNKIFNANSIDLTGMSAAYNQTTDVLNRWTAEGTSNNMPRAVFGDPNQNTRVSDRYVENGSYIRLKTLSLSYNFPKSWLKVLTVQNARLTLSCENVFTITKYSGFDPEVDINGIDLSRYPISRTFNLGINFNF
jgi:TonB-linked SusC/RagA family outer membrane protein